MAASRLQGWRHRPSVLRVLAVYFALGAALRAGDVWVAGSKLHRSIEAYLSPQASAAPVPARLPAPPALTAVRYLDDRAALLDQRLLEVGRKLASGQCAGATLDRDRLSLPKPEAKDDPEARLLARRLYGLMPHVRITDLLLFRAMARAFVHAHKPRSPVMIAYGGEFAEFVAAYLSAAEARPGLVCLADVARLENVWVEAYHPAASLRSHSSGPE